MSSAKPSYASSTTDSQKQVSSKDSDASESVAIEEKPAKKLPPIKAPVGLAKSPDLRNCKSKIGSLNNIKHTPAGGGVTIPSQKLKWNAKSKVGSLDNKEHQPGGGKLKVESRKLEWKTTSRVQSLQNVHHKPGGGNVKIFNESYAADKSSTKRVATATSNEIGTAETNNDTSKTKPTSERPQSLSKNMKGLTLKD